MGVSTSVVIVITILGCMMREGRGVPMASVMGCGQASSKLALEKKLYCCSQFGLNCDASVERFKTEQAKKSKEASAETARKAKEQKARRSSSLPLLRVRTLGQTCTSMRVRCATGLECRMGICLRKKGARNLRHLIEVGKKVEEEERTENEFDDYDQEDPLPAKDNFLIQGQSVSMDSNSLSTVSSGIDRRTVRITTSASSDPSSANVNNSVALKLDKAASGIEEDEVTANIADYLASKGKKLNEKEWKTVRELISGTLDERSQREDEVDEQEEASKGSNDNEKQSKLQPSGNPSPTEGGTSASAEAGQCDAK